ncbi:MAG: S8 family serine peptidase [Sedimentisphaerales bacterium]|nr:S8 family serine peptidase [Sedimentisphaerales bacterium]
MVCNRYYFGVLLAGALLLISVNDIGFADVGRLDGVASTKNSQQQQVYVPNQLLVKFRSETVGQVEAGTDQNKAAVSISESLKRLNQRFQVRKTERVFPDFAGQQKKMERIRRKAVEQLTKQEKRLLQRDRRAGNRRQVPALDRIYILELVEGQDLAAALAACKQDPAVEYAELNYILHEHMTPDDTHFSIQWPLENTGQMYPESGKYNHPPGEYDADIDMPDAWDIFTGSADIVVAVIDTGVDYNHRDINDNMWVNQAELSGTAGLDDDLNGYIDDVYGYDFYNRDGDPMDDRGHGTHCAGTIAAETNNLQDIAGMCWQAKIMAVKFLGSGGYGSTSNAVKSFYYAVANGAEVTSNSWGGGPYSETLEEAIEYATSQGVIVVAAAGNDDTNVPEYPANYTEAIAVAATNSNDDKASFSNFGDWVDLAAPGVDILSLRSSLASSYFGTPYDDYTVILSGTSMACPHVSGACALLIGVNPTLTRDEVYDLLMTTGDSIAEGICLSDSRLNVYNLLLNAVSQKARIQFSQDEYSCADEISVILSDADLAGQSTVPVTIETTGGDDETLQMNERSTGIGMYDGTIVTQSGTPIVEDGIMQVTDGQTITVIYYDANDGTGNPAVCQDTATADCAGPVILTVQAAQVEALWARIYLETDEPSQALVNYGEECNNLSTGTAEDPILSLSCNVYLYNLDSETTYSFEVIATDEFGNETVDTNDSQCYSFTTLAEVPGRHVPIEYPTIQAAIDAALPGETVWVADGNYCGQGNRDLDFGGKAITVQSEYGPENCIIDCQGSADEPRYGFYFHNAEDANSVLSGFTIMGGFAEYIEYIGGGIICDGSSPTIENCVLFNNEGAYGGGMRNTNSSPSITNCQFISNAAHLFGGAIHNYDNSHPNVTDCEFIDNVTDSIYSDEYGGGAVGNDSGSNPIFTNCRFEDNFTYGLGAGMYNKSGCSPVLKNCIFINNDADWGGAGLGNDYGNCHPYMVNCLFISNTADQGGGIYCGFGSSLTVINCVFNNNQATNTGGGIWVYNSSIQVVNSTFNHNEALCWGGGIHLQSLVEGDISNSIFQQNRDSVGYTLDAQISSWMDLGLYYNCIEQWEPVTDPNKQGNINACPLFLDADGDDEIIGTEDDNLRQGPGSPCIDAGNNNRVPLDFADLDEDSNSIEKIPWDLDKDNRFVDDTNTPDTGVQGPDPNLPVVDMGAYEGPYQGFLVLPQQVIAPEGSTASFTISLGLAPAGPLTVTVSYHSGDEDISVQSGSVLFFDDSNYLEPQTVVLEAAEDEDFVNSTTLIVIGAEGIPSRKITTIESDNEPVPAVVYVDAAATGTQTGLSWSDAFIDLQTILKHAEKQPGITELRVAQGIYRPAGAYGDKYESFNLINGLALRGGYAGTQSASPNDRDILLYPAILSGDLNEDDEPEFVNRQDNSYHVVMGRGLDSNTVLEGFVIQAGNASGMDIHADGAGMLNREGSNPVIMDCNFNGNLSSGNGSGMCNDNSSPQVIRCKFTGNSMGGNSGGGMYNSNSSPTVESCEFIGNYAGVGGAMANFGSGTAIITGCLFKNNQASFGGGLYTNDDCSPIVTDCIFQNNQTGYTGGALELRDGNPTFKRCRIINNYAGQYDWGGAGINMFNGNATFESCTIADNTSYENGGAMFVWNGHAYMYNCTISGNSADDQGGGIFLFSHLSGSATLRSCILWNNYATEVEGKTISVQYSDVRGGYSGTGNKNEDPQFVDAAGGDYHLWWNSPCIDTGDPAYSPQPEDKDIDNEPRVMQNSRVDMGSDEVGPKQADFTRDGIIDVLDLSILSRSWLTEENDVNWYVLCDLYDDQKIDMIDYALFAADWLWQGQWYGD